MLESKTTEFKREYVDDIKFAVVAFANTDGGKIYIGLNDDGTVRGVEDVDGTMLRVTNMVRDTSGDRYEDARSVNQLLTFEKTAAYFKKKNIEFGEGQKRTLHIIGEDGTYSSLGMLLSDQNVHTIKMAVFDGSKKNVFRDRREFTGSLLAQLEEAYAYIDQLNRTHAEFEGLNRIDERDYPLEALREALLNAIVHRDYAINGSTLISIFDDRIEMVTIGGLVGGITFDDIMLGVSVLRNQHLADVFYRLKLIEAYGTGMLKINECYAEYTVKPQIEVTDHAFKITLPNVNFSKSIQPLAPQKATPVKVPSKDAREEIIISLLESRDTIIRKDVEDALGVSQATAILILRKMVDKGILLKDGGGKYLCYRLNSQVNS